jgi:DNA modification methylase
MSEKVTQHLFYVGDVLQVLKQIPDESIHCVVTSPPYWGLRNYGVDGQIGLEKTPDEYVAKLVEVFREVRRVLRKDGTLWLNLGDSYNGSGGAGGDYNPGGLREGQPKYPGRKVGSLKPKDLVGIPWRVAFALQADGWYLRSDIIWAKPNAMPESVKDRPTKAHEYVFLLAKSKKYFYDADAIREPHVRLWNEKNGGTFAGGKQSVLGGTKQHRGPYPLPNPFGRNKRSVWIIPTEPFPDAHFATFPTALVEPCIKAGTSERGCCPKCGAPWERVVEYKRPENAKPKKPTESWNVGTGLQPHRGYRGTPVVECIGWRPTCSCGIEETVPCVVLDPFGGAGTTNLVAAKLGRSSIYIDLNSSYVDMAIRRLNKYNNIFRQYEVKMIDMSNAIVKCVNH